MPTVTRNMISTVTDTTNEKIDISEAIDFLDPFEAPMLDLVGRDSLHSACTQVAHYWLEDEFMPRAGTLGAAYTAGQGSLTFASLAEGGYLLPDDTILIDNIVFRILGGPPDTQVATVEVIGGTDAAITNSSAWRKVAHAAQEGGNARTDAVKTALTKPYNYTQIVKDWIMVTGTMEVIDRYGYASERAYQEDKALKRLALDLEQAILYGVRSYDAGPPRKSSFGGLLHYILLAGITNSWDTVYDANSADLTETMLVDRLQDVWDQGGDPDFIMVNGTNKRRITAWASPRIRTDRDMRTAGSSIAVFESDFGNIDILLNRNLRPADVVIGTRSQIGLGPLTGRQFTSRPLPELGDYTWYEILGEYTMEVHKPSVDFGWIYNTSTTY